MSISRMDVPIGTVLDYAGSSIPAGYLECDGSAVSRTAYPKLFLGRGGRKHDVQPAQLGRAHVHRQG